MRTWILPLLLLWAGAATAAEYKMVTGSEKGTYIKICQDLATHVAPDSGFDLECLPSTGSSENVFRLRFESGVKLALVQSDTMAAFADQARAGNKGAASLVSPLRAVLPLYNEEIYFLVRADSPLKFIHDIKDIRINAGPIGSGTALTTLTLYRAMFKADPTVTNLSNEDGLIALASGKTDVVAVVGGQPMALFTGMQAGAKSLVKFLQLDPGHPTTRDVLKTYIAATIRQTSYPNLIDADFTSVAIRAYLVTYDFNLNQTGRDLRNFARSLCKNMPSLKSHGHPKWKEVELALPDLGEGWSYYNVTTRELKACGAPPPPPPKPAGPPPRPACTATETVLGLCK